MDIRIDWKEIDSQEEFYDLFLKQVKAPKWHGHNLDALADSLITGQINEIEPPYTIINLNTGSAPGHMNKFQREVLSIFSDASIERREIKVVIE
ncbi:MAG: barstar family protein [Planctomycetota bacterium]|jgi:RNAse (barnase) inhibitor barstar